MDSGMLVISLLIFGLLSSVDGACYDQKDCRTCNGHTGYFSLPCSWCLLSDTCHTYGSLYNACEDHIAISNISMCPEELPKGTPAPYYNQTLASQLAQWASLAYAKPAAIDPLVLTKVLQTELPGQYRVLKFLQKYCDILMHYSACSLLVAVSDQERNIIVSFEGTQNMDQLFEQLTSAILTGLENSDVGGRVLYYNHNVHQLLYPCLKMYLKSLLEKNPSYRLTLTGHSLGGAQAQLAAAALIHDGLVPTDMMHVYTFGAPRFGDSEFANHFDKLVKNNWRLVQATDPVPRIPPYFVYHTHEEVWYSEPGISTLSNYTICDVNEDEECALSQSSVPCFTEECVEVHKSYFVNDMGREFAEGKLAGDNYPSKSVLGNCDSVDFTNH